MSNFLELTAMITVIAGLPAIFVWLGLVTHIVTQRAQNRAFAQGYEAGYHAAHTTATSENGNHPPH